MFPMVSPMITCMKSLHGSVTLKHGVASLDILAKYNTGTYREEKGLSPGGRSPTSFIHQVIIITGLNKSYMSVCSRPEDGLKLGVKPPLKLKRNGLRCRLGVKPPIKLELKLIILSESAFYPPPPFAHMKVMRYVSDMVDLSP